jgi:hypothetical protein
MSEQRQEHTESTEAGRVPGGRRQSERFNAVAFWLLFVFLLGVCVGTGAAFKYHSRQLDRSIQLGCFVHDGVVYEVQPKAQK